MPKVSIIIPVYNVEKYLRQCLDSVVCQTLDDIEIICINDGSSDNSLAILNEYASKDSRIKVISQENQGAGMARNTGIKIANGEFIAFVDPDDFVIPDFCEAAYDFAVLKNADVIQFDYTYFKEIYRKYKKYSFLKKYKKISKVNSISKTGYYSWKDIKNGIFCDIPFYCWCRLYRTKFIKEQNIAFSDARRGEDHIFVFCASLLADKIYFLDKSLYYYRVRNDSLATKCDDENLLVFKNIDILRKFLLDHNFYEILEEEFQRYVFMVLCWQYKNNTDSVRSEYERLAQLYVGKENFESLKQKWIPKFELNFVEKIFSIKNFENYKIITILGIKFRIKRV